MPGEVERVGAVEHAEVVGLAPDDLLPAGPHGERDAAELDVGVRLAELVVELERIPRTLAEAVYREGLPLEATQLGELEEVETPVRLPVDVLLLENPRRRVVDAVVDAAVLDEEMRALEEGDGVFVIKLASLEPVVIELEVGGVPVLDELVGRHVRAAGEVLRLEVARELDRPQLGRRNGGFRCEREKRRRERAEKSQVTAENQHDPLPPDT